MRVRQYVDLDLTIEADGDEYVARVVDSPAGQATHRFRLPFDPVALENFVLKLGHNRTTTRRAHSPRLAVARSFGKQLYETVFDSEVEVAFRTSLREALASERGVRIRLRVDGAPGLAEVPWEYLYSEGLGRFLVMSSDTPLVRFLEVPTGSAPLTVEPPLRVLVMVSSPTDLDRLDVEREVELLRQATADLTEAGTIELEVAERADLTTLLRQLRRSEFHVFHFIGHGVFDPRQDDGLLMLVDEDGRSRPVSGLELGVLLHDHHSLRLAVLNACEGARGSVDDPMGGVAQTLIRQGLPAAVAMQFEISDEAALVFAHEFYLAIADGYPIDAATSEARKAIFASGNDVEWGTPVLHLRATDGRVFEMKGKPAAPTHPVATPRELATAALTEGRFADAVAAWEEIVTETPGDEAAVLMLERARHRLEAVGLYEDAAVMVEQGRHEDATRALDRMDDLDPEHGDPDGLREAIAVRVAEEERRAAETERKRKEEGERKRAAEEERKRKEEEERRRAAAEAERKRKEEEDRRLAAADAEVARARKAMARGDLEETERRLEVVLGATPNHPGAMAARDEVRRLRESLTTQSPPSPADDLETAPPVTPEPATEEKLPSVVGSRRTAGWMTVGGGLIGALVLGWAVFGDGETPPATTGTNQTTPTTSVTTGVTRVELPAGMVGVVPVSDIRIDGDPGDWPASETTASNHTVFPNPGADPNVTARWRVGWDEEALYVLVEASDGSVDPGTFDNPSQLWRGDSVHFEAGAAPEGAGSLRSDDLHILLAPIDRSGSEVLAAINPAIDGQFRAGPSGSDTGIAAAMRGNDDGYLIEAAVPWSVLGVLDPAPNLELGLNLNISDGDGSGGLEQMVSSNPDRTGENQPRPVTWHSALLLRDG